VLSITPQANTIRRLQQHFSMTTLQAARNLETTKKRAADEAPKHHAKKPKTSISVAGLFAKKPRAVRENLQSTDGTSRKRLSSEGEITAKAKRHQIYLDVKGTETPRIDGLARS
jgi:hypothetical protein